MNSEEQFLELVSNSIPRANKMLAELDYILPFGLIYKTGGKMETLLTTLDIPGQVLDLVDFLKQQLTEKVSLLENEATCIVYPDYKNLQVVCLLENRENYCAKYLIPVTTENGTLLNPSETTIEDSYIYVFPLEEDS